MFGRNNPTAILLIELPATIEVLEDVPYDSENPLFPIGYGSEV